MNRISFSIFLGLLLCIAPSVQAQVTIGSGTEPNPGALLDLRQDGTTTKGLGMPRLRLTDKSKLYPMFETTVGSGTPNTSYDDATKKGVQDAAHTGLMVYNIDQCTLLGKGLYVWDGTQWQILGQEIVSLEGMVKKLGTAQDAIAANGAAWHKDQEGNIFFSMNFDSANPTLSTNRWMTTNLAATSFATIPRTGTDAGVRQNFGISPSGGASTEYLTPLWAYPKKDAAITVGETVSSDFVNNPRLGRLYNWAAATNSLGGLVDGASNPTDAQGGQSYTASPAHRKIQGICPNGWHLPSDYEWTQLENEIIKNTATYSSTGNIVAPVLDPVDNGVTGTTNRLLHGEAMKGVCEPVVGDGTSNSPLGGGFSALLAGYGTNGSSLRLGVVGYFWSSSSFNSSAAWYRCVDATRAMSRVNGVRNYLFSVRCKKD